MWSWWETSANTFGSYNSKDLWKSSENSKESFVAVQRYVSYWSFCEQMTVIQYWFCFVPKIHDINFHQETFKKTQDHQWNLSMHRLINEPRLGWWLLKSVPQLKLSWNVPMHVSVSWLPLFGCTEHTLRWSNFDPRDPKMGVFLQSTEATPCGHLLKWKLTPCKPWKPPCGHHVHGRHGRGSPVKNRWRFSKLL